MQNAAMPPENQQVRHEDYDSPWKEILEQYFREFMEFFFPEAYAEIDWGQQYEFLDKELQQITRDSELGRRLVDKLVKVFTTDGQETWLVVHIEVQGQYDRDFAKRMFVYYYRLFDRFDRDIVSLAVLADDRKRWRPKRFQRQRWGCEERFTFPIVKLVDYDDSENALNDSRNPFAIVVLAYLKTRATRKTPEHRLYWKLRVFKMLYERGYSHEDILELTRFLDWIMVLPEELEERFDEALFQFEEEQKMRYVTSFERYGLKQGREQGMQQGIQQGMQQGMQQGQVKATAEAVIENLRLRFAGVPDMYTEAILQITDLAVLKHLHRKSVTSESFDDFLTCLQKHAIVA